MECIQLSLFGKMCPEHSVPTAAKISEPCWKNLPALHNQTLQFLDLRVGEADGTKPGQSPETDGLWHGDRLMLNTGEFPNAERESRLSWILEDNVPEKYCLSARACQGILTRASRRGKPLPDILKKALLDVIGSKSYTLKIRSGCEGGGKGALAQTEKSATLSTLQDQTLFQPMTICTKQFSQTVSYEQAGTLGASDYKEPQAVFCIAGNVIDRSDTAGANGTGVKENVSYTLNTVDRPAVVYDARGNGDGEVVPTMTGDHNSLVTDYTAITLVNQDVAGPLLARDYKGVGRQDSLSRIVAQPNAIDAAVHWVVRRLTPTECERLQGYPDGWTVLGEWVDSKGKPHKDADTPRYKALGNSIALPQWFWLVQKMRPYLKEKPTLGSLFDGLGGFPLVWQKAYGEGTARWASEIERFCVAVTKMRFGEE